MENKLKFIKTENKIALVDEAGTVVMAEYWPWSDQQERCYRKLAEMMEGI